MPGTAPRHRWLIHLLCGFLLLAQVTGAHLHVCLDGQAPRLQVHLFDAPAAFPAANPGVPHVDEILSLSADRSVRDPSSQFDLPPVLAATHVWRIAPVPALAQSPVWLTDAPPGAARHDLLPPLRGPPLTTQA
jgi:hypothetical protein